MDGHTSQTAVLALREIESATDEKPLQSPLRNIADAAAPTRTRSNNEVTATALSA